MSEIHEVIEVEHHPCHRVLILMDVEEGSYEYYLTLLRHIIWDCPDSPEEMVVQACADLVALQMLEEKG